MTKTTTVGVLSDTHGLVRPEVLEALMGSDLILHAGDIGSSQVLETLRSIAPVYAVRGNVDKEPWGQEIPLTKLVAVGKYSFYVIHEIGGLALDPATPYDAVIYGHSHKPLAEYRKGVLFLNPGSAGPRRFRLPVAVARVYVTGDELEHEIIELAV